MCDAARVRVRMRMRVRVRVPVRVCDVCGRPSILASIRDRLRCVSMWRVNEARYVTPH